MRSFALCAAAAGLLTSAPAFAVVADTFKCSLRLFDKAGNEGARASAQLASVRVPEAVDPYWVEGVVGADGGIAMKLKAPGITVAFEYRYTLFSSPTRGTASQWACFDTSYETDYPGPSSMCFHADHAPPYDPTLYNSPTTLSASGIPLFLTQNLHPVETPIEHSLLWSKFRVECDHTGTVE